MNHAIALDEGLYYLWKVRAGIRKWDDYAGRRLDLDQALELAPGDLNIIVQLGLLDFDQRNWRAAEERFSVEIAKDGADFGVLAYRAMTKLKQNDPLGAKKDYDAAVAAAAGPGDLSRICSAFVIEGIALDWAAESCNRAVAAQPTSAIYHARRGLLEIRLDQLDRAIADYDAAVAHEPNLAFAYYGRGVAYLRKGNRAKAIADREQARAIEPTVDEYFVAHGIPDLDQTVIH
jgi:tetratricopeptide (TPR) repeat protein